MSIIEALGEEQSPEIKWIYSARHCVSVITKLFWSAECESSAGWRYTVCHHMVLKNGALHDKENFNNFFELSLSLRFCHLKLLLTSPGLINWHHNNKKDCYTEEKIEINWKKH